ncbi:MAG: hypothetical protein ABIJ11_03255 [Elusimicrobiota bacterium]
MKFDSITSRGTRVSTASFGMMQRMRLLRLPLAMTCEDEIASAAPCNDMLGAVDCSGGLGV